MKPVLVMFLFGVPAGVALLLAGGDLHLAGYEEPPVMPAGLAPCPEGPQAGAGSLIRQKIQNWEYRHFDPQVGVFDWFARGSQAIPLGEDVYEVVKPEVLFSTFTTTTPLLKKSLTRLNAGGGRVRFTSEELAADLSGEVTIQNTELFTPRGMSELRLRTQNMHLQAAHRKPERTPQARFHCTGTVHVVGESFEAVGGGGMKGETELNRITILPPVTMRVAAGRAGLPGASGDVREEADRHIAIESEGPLLIERAAADNLLLVSSAGGVVLRDGLTVVECRKADIAFREGAEMESADLAGAVKVRQGQARVLLGENAAWNRKDARLVVAGKDGVRFTEGGNVLSAASATFMEDDKTLLLAGGVRGELERAGGGSGSKGGAFPARWRVNAGSARLLLTRGTGAPEVEEVLLSPAAGQTVVMTSADSAYIVKGGEVAWDARTGVAKVTREPELSRGRTESVRAAEFSLSTKDSLAVFEGDVCARFEKEGAAWDFRAQRMTATFEAPKGANPSIKTVTLTAPGSRVLLDYIPPNGATVRLTGERISWDASTREALADSPGGEGSQMLERGRDWVRARKVSFSPDAREGRFEGEVRAHFEGAVGAPREGGTGVEPPFEMASDVLALELDEQYATRSAHARGAVRFEAGGGLVLTCRDARYIRGELVTFEAQDGPELMSGKNRLTADRIEVHLREDRVVFHDRVSGTFDDGGGSALTMNCKTMVALYRRETGSLKEVYAEGGVHMEAQAAEGKVAADGERAMYEVEKGCVSLAGTPLVLTRGAITAREETAVYDIRERVLFTGPGRRGYDWSIDPSGWVKKRGGK